MKNEVTGVKNRSVISFLIGSLVLITEVLLFGFILLYNGNLKPDYLKVIGSILIITGFIVFYLFIRISNHYFSNFKNKKNYLYGCIVGLVFGVGVKLYYILNGSQQDYGAILDGVVVLIWIALIIYFYKRLKSI